MKSIHRFLSVPPADYVARVRWYINIRWFVLLSVAVPGIFALYIGEGLSEQVRRHIVLGVFAVASNGLFYLLTRVNSDNAAYFRRIATCVVIFDVFLIGFLVFINGGVESRSPILFTILILISAALFGRRAVYTTAVACFGVYNFIVIADYLDIIRTLSDYNVEIRGNFAYVLNSVAFITSVLLIFALIVDFITGLLISKETQANESFKALKEAQSVAKFGSWEWDVKADTVSWSDQLFELFGVPLREEPITFEDYLQILHPDDTETVKSHIAGSIKKAQKFSFTHRIIRPDGIIRHVQSDGRPITNDSGEVIKLIGTARDVTDTKLLDEAKSEFVSLASHQLRTPATGVKQYVGMLLDGFAGPLNTEQEKFLKIAYESNERQLRIVNDLLKVASVDSGKVKLKIKRTDIVKMIVEILDEQKDSFALKRQQVSFEHETPRIFADVDAPRLRMALENIIENARKYTLEDKNIEVCLNERGDDLIIAVSDEGVGIADKDMEKIFHKFGRIERSETGKEGGTGLGLYWSLRIAKLHGGTMNVESKLDHGTTFEMILPQKQPAIKVDELC